MSKVYILENAEGISKLGFTSVSAESRRAMCSSTMCSDFSVIAYFDDPATPARKLERMGHNLLSDYRIATKDCKGNNCFEYYKMPTETMALLMAFLMEGTRDNLEFHEFGRQQPRAKLLSKLLFGIKRAKRAIAEGWVLKSGSRSYRQLGWSPAFEDCYLEESTSRGRGADVVAAHAVSNECIIRINQEICSMQELMTKAKQKTLPNFVEA